MVRWYAALGGLFLGVGLAATGCRGGSLERTGADGGATADAASSEVDGAGTPDGFQIKDWDAGRRRCADTYCGFGSRCVDGSCVCDPGFERDARDGCQRIEVGEPAARTRRSVCRRWRNDSRTSAPPTRWLERPEDDCDTGRLAPELQRHALRMTNLYRWLVGLAPVSTRPRYLAAAQACATALAAEGRPLTHSIAPSYRCHSPAAEQGAKASNIARGVDSPAASVHLYVADPGVASLGHRRWVLNPGMAATGFGMRGEFSCMYVFDDAGRDDRTRIFYPAPGIFPIGALRGRWSLMADASELPESPRVEVTRTADDKRLEVSEVHRPAGNFGRLAALSWKVEGVRAGTEYRVEITGSDTDSTLGYRTTLVDCQ